MECGSRSELDELMNIEQTNKEYRMMKYSTFILLLILLLYHISCKNNSEKEKMPETIMDSNVYEDIDLFKLEGIREIKKPINYPYIIIRSHGDFEKKIVYKRSLRDITELIYKRNGDYWESIHEYWMDSGYTRIYEYVKKDYIIELIYYGSPQKNGFHLDDLSIITNNKKTFYSFWDKKGPFIEPDIKNFDLVKNKANVIVTDEFNIKDGTLTIISNSFDKRRKEKFRIDTTCYNIGKHSLFWFREFGWSKEIECN